MQLLFGQEGIQQFFNHHFVIFRQALDFSPSPGALQVIGQVGVQAEDWDLAAEAFAALAEAAWHTSHRAAFGATLADQPAMTNVLADLAVESEAATALGIRLAGARARGGAAGRRRGGGGAP